jgi:hypothetical protein
MAYPAKSVNSLPLFRKKWPVFMWQSCLSGFSDALAVSTEDSLVKMLTRKVARSVVFRNAGKTTGFHASGEFLPE